MLSRQIVRLRPYLQQPMVRRMFATAEYETLDDNLYYTPVRDVSIKGASLNIFDNVQNHDTSKTWIVPFEMKNEMVKTGVGFFGLYLGYLCLPHPTIWLFGGLGIWGNMIYRSYTYMGHAITRTELLKGGTQVRVHFKTGGSATWDIKDIQKERHEKELLETLHEPFMFPVKYRDGKTYYFLGNGHESIKNGELFRAVLNGKAIKI